MKTSEATEALEAACLSAICNLAATDMGGAQSALDLSGAQAQDFTDTSARAVWSAVEAQIRDGRVPDVVAVGARLPGVPRAVLARLMLSDSETPAAERLQVLHELGVRRRCWKALEVVRGLLADTSQGLPHVAGEARKAVEGLEVQTSNIATLDGEVLSLIDRMEEVASGRRDGTLRTGLHGLDEVIGGLQATLTIVGAMPGVGKSALLAGIVRNIAERGVKVGFFSLEDERGWLVERLMAEASQIPVFTLANRPLSKEQRERLSTSAPAVYALLRNVVVDDRPRLSASDIVASAREMLTRHSVKALFVDHLGEIALSRTDRHDLDIAEALSQLRALAKTYKVPVVVACHVRRRDGMEQSAEPKLTDFAFSAAVERMARVALALSIPKEDPNSIRVHVLKQTRGQSGVTVDLTVNKPAAVVANAQDPTTRRITGSFYDAQEWK